MPDSYYDDLSWSGGIGLNNPTYLLLTLEKRLAISRAFKNEDGDPDTIGTPKVISIIKNPFLIWSPFII